MDTNKLLKYNIKNKQMLKKKLLNLSFILVNKNKKLYKYFKYIICTIYRNLCYSVDYFMLYKFTIRKLKHHDKYNNCINTDYNIIIFILSSIIDISDKAYSPF